VSRRIPVRVVFQAFAGGYLIVTKIFNLLICIYFLTGQHPLAWIDYLLGGQEAQVWLVDNGLVVRAKQVSDLMAFTLKTLGSMGILLEVHFLIHTPFKVIVPSL